MLPRSRPVAFTISASLMTRSYRPELLDSFPILPSTLGEKPTLRGALSLVLASKFAAAFAA